MISLLPYEDADFPYGYTLINSEEVVGHCKWRDIGNGVAELHFTALAYRKGYLDEYRRILYDVVKKDMQTQGFNKILAMVSEDTDENVRKFVKFWQLMGFSFFCGMVEV
jgi:hypothetical protein